jgi:hypothetical protein
MTQWARAIGAARSGDVAAADSAVKELAKSVEERDQRARKSGCSVSTEKATDLAEAEVRLAFAQGKTDQALSGDSSSAQTFYAKLTQVCPAGADRPELAEAKTVLARK